MLSSVRKATRMYVQASISPLAKCIHSILPDNWWKETPTLNLERMECGVTTSEKLVHTITVREARGMPEGRQRSEWLVWVTGNKKWLLALKQPIAWH